MRHDSQRPIATVPPGFSYLWISAGGTLFLGPQAPALASYFLVMGDRKDLVSATGLPLAVFGLRTSLLDFF